MSSFGFNERFVSQSELPRTFPCESAMTAIMLVPPRSTPAYSFAMRRLLSGAGVLVRKHLCNRRGQVLRVLDVEELVRTVGIAVRAEDAGDQELRLRVALAEHGHEGNRAAFAERHRPFAEVRLRRALDRLLQPRRRGRRLPSAAALLRIERDARAVGGIAFE